MNDSIARAIAHAANRMSETATVEETLEVIVRSAAEALPHFDHVGIGTKDGEEPMQTRAASSDLVRQLDDIQNTVGEGPCLESLQGTEVIVAPHIHHEQRWPKYVPSAVAIGLQAQLAVRLHLDASGTMGGLNLYSTSRDQIAADDITTAALFATHAAVALGKAHEVESLSHAVATRQLIGQAIGILMHQYSLDEKSAQAFLWRASSTSNVKVRDIAERILAEANRAGAST